MFEKKIASESVKIVDEDWAALSRIFNKLGKEEASEFEVWKAAKDLEIPTPKNIGKYCSISKPGLLKFKK